MDEHTFKKKLEEIVSHFDDVPAPHKDKLMDLAKQTKESHKRLRHKIETLQHSLDYLRVNVKYLLFDLEATRRENAHYKKLLDDKNRGK